MIPTYYNSHPVDSKFQSVFVAWILCCDSSPAASSSALAAKTQRTVVHPVCYCQSSPCSPALCSCDHLFRCVCALITLCLSCFFCCQPFFVFCLFFFFSRVCSCARAYYCVSVCHVTAGQPIRKTPTRSGRTAVQ